MSQLLAALLLASLTCYTPAPGRTDGRVYYYVPKGIDTTKPVSLLVFLHGGDDTSPDTTPEAYLGEGGCLMPEFESAPFIVVAPSAPPAPDGSRWNRAGVSKLILATIEDAKRRYPTIDRNRIFLGGHSMGCYGAYHLGQILADKFAGVWLSAGAWWQGDFRNFLGTAVFMQHGTWDCAASYSNHSEPRHHSWCSVDFARAADALMARYLIDRVYVEHGGGHSLSWEPARMATRRFLSWARDQRRNPYPDLAALTTPCGTGHPDFEPKTRSYWLEMCETIPGKIAWDAIELRGPEIAHTLDEFLAQSYRLSHPQIEGARICAANKGGNKFTVEAENVAAFRIYLAPQMGALDKPFTIDAGPLGVRVLRAAPVAGELDYQAVLEWKK